MSPEDTAAMAIEEVLNRHEDRLMEIPGVVGIGVGERAGRPVVKVMLDRPVAELSTRLPADLEGFPLDVDFVGEITAL